MITKILFTALVIIAALAFVRHKNRVAQAEDREAQQRQAAAERRGAMIVALLLVVLTLLISGGVYYWHWQEAHRIAIIQVINSHSGAEQQYRVYQSEIDGRRFRTIDGRVISLSDAERMEIIEADTVYANGPGQSNDSNEQKE